MPEIVLATLNARYAHSSFGLRYLLANMGEQQSQTTLLEFVINDHPVEVLATILAENPAIVGLGVYIWNVEQTTKLVADLKQVRPEMVVILGGPEVSYETDGQPIVELADYVVIGEGDLAFRDLCQRLQAGERPVDKLIYAAVPLMDQVQLPYELYTDEDLANRVLYVEASRGCPFTCEFCLSSLEIPVRLIELDRFLGEMQKLFDRGARQFKFVDRTFNLNLRVSRAILQFFLDRYEPGMFLHFEMIPDRLPDSLRELIAKFPAGALQFEIGVQSFDPLVGTLISRVQDNEKLEANFRFLREQTGVHIHADLIVGLPGESLESFSAGFDRLFALRPQEIQVGILKRLRGTPIVRHDAEWEMVYSPHPPYEILSNRLLSFEDIHRLRRFSRHWDLIGNSGNFGHTLPLICSEYASAFEQFSHLSEWLFERNQRMHGIALVRLVEFVFEYLCQLKRFDHQRVAEAMWHDYGCGGRREKPSFFKGFSLVGEATATSAKRSIPDRQGRHLRKVSDVPSGREPELVPPKLADGR
ncbi:MAG: radical SAM protein [Pirellulaceae bacterium]|nr:radical SAM protein [Pirellulaceae bacterium]